MTLAPKSNQSRWMSPAYLNPLGLRFFRLPAGTTKIERRTEPRFPPVCHPHRLLTPAPGSSTMIGIVDYGMGNLRSVQKGLERVELPPESVHIRRIFPRSTG